MDKDVFVLDEPVSNFIKLRQLDRYMIGHKGYAAGGVFKNIFNDEKFKDVDFFFENQKDYEEANALFKSDENYKLKYENKKVRAYTNKETGVTVELIRHMFASPLEMISSFDFTITKFVYYKEEHEAGYDIEDEFDDGIEWKVAYHNKFFEHLHLKRLVIDQDEKDIMFPVNSLNRMFRYAKYGYFPCRETKAKIIQALRDMPDFDDEALSLEMYNGMD